ncbi:LacI family DNA-binding transcriptional regulator [Clostridium aestuarii]|uniref:LacI family DNA-binding transcriptional regulator n=1 Tax=Clostridium aestuarii TaxID=338193 RepID=A0ABT4D0J5_9CLOT|nr:LacI family DNA-binding transcriptional regulator [Clostridium aestuarii]MCY6484756.1 LacI family DNA-binding transcriptional regulator [Clostridium aestuarii]
MSVTIYDIAEKAGISRTTVSRVLNNSGYVKEETRQKVLKAIKELNYTPSAIARSLSTSRTNTIGVVVPEISDPFFGEIIKGIGEIADKHELNIILFDTADSVEKELKALKLLRQQRIEGIMITPTFTEKNFNSEYLNTLEKLEIPVILMDGHVNYEEFSGVFIDHVRGAYDGTEALIKSGHRKIAIITGDMNSRPAKERLKGYKKCLIRNNIKVQDRYIFCGDYKYENAYQITKKILKMEDRPTAIFVCSNMMSLGCVKAFNEEKITIPNDMAIVGFDKLDVLNILGLNISFVNGLTTELGRVGTKMLIDKINNKNKKNNRQIERITLLPELILKGSERYIYNKD